MKTFLAIYTGSPAAMSQWGSLSEEQRQTKQREGIAAWYAWTETHKAQIVSIGGPLGKTKRASPSGIEDIRNALTGYTLVQAESHDEAAKLFENHPHFTIFPGEGVEIMECLPIPGMDAA